MSIKSLQGNDALHMAVRMKDHNLLFMLLHFGAGKWKKKLNVFFFFFVFIFSCVCVYLFFVCFGKWVFDANSLILNNYSDPNSKDSNGLSPLLWLLKHGNRTAAITRKEGIELRKPIRYLLKFGGKEIN